MSARILERWEKAWRQNAHRWIPLGKMIARLTGWRVWNPGEYGAVWHSRFRHCYAPIRHPLVCFGLNPGPYGMAQTGVPFTDLKRLISSLPRLAAQIRLKDERLELPGLAPRSLHSYLTRTFESSSVRFYRFLERGWGEAELGWKRVVVANPCPLLFMDAAVKRNRTPADLSAALGKRGVERARVREIMAQVDHLRGECAEEAVDLFQPTGVVLFGRNASAVLSPVLNRKLGNSRVLSWEHPARAIPDKWSAGLVGRLRRRGLFPEA